MSFDFAFRSLERNRDLTTLVDFLMQQDLRYPDYEAWVVGKAKPELESGYKKAILAFSEGHLVGDLIYQSHKELPGVLEFKNLRIHPNLRERSFARFMIRQAEMESKEYSAIILDLRLPEQKPLYHLLLSMGYQPITQRPLYEQSTADTIMIKTFDQRTPAGIVYSKAGIISKVN